MPRHPAAHEISIALASDASLFYIALQSKSVLYLSKGKNMNRKVFTRSAVLILALSLAILGQPRISHAAAGTVGAGVPPFHVRPGYRVTLATKGLRNARFLCFGPHGTLFVSEPATGQIVALRNPDAHGYFQSRDTFVSGYRTVQGMVYRKGWLWFTVSGGIYRAKDDGKPGKATQIVKVLEGLPHGGGHWWRSLCIRHGHFYTSIGDSSNFSDQIKTDRCKIWEYNLDGTGRSLFCSGLRNTEKLLFRPGTDQLWGCDEGSDQIGVPLGETWQLHAITNHNPPDEFNHYVRGGFYGQPYITGNDMPRYEYVKQYFKTGHPNLPKWAAKCTVPAWDFGAHWSTVSFCFLRGNYFPGQAGNAIICCHGSWDSIPLVGYRLQMVLFDKWTGKPYGSKLIVSTMHSDHKSFMARPVDCAQAPDGSLVFSSDSNGCVYRLKWVGKAAK